MKKNPDLSCPLCQGPMTVIGTRGDIWVVCQNPCDPLCKENVAGHGTTEQAAYGIACEKYRKR